MNENNFKRDGYAEEALRASMKGEKTFCKFLSPNDTGLTGGHQSGIYIPKSAVTIIFDHPFEKGQNHDRWVKISWQDGEITDGHCIYYGQGTRNEYRITGFGRGFQYLHPMYTGALFVLVQLTPDDYQGFILNTDYEIDYFLDAYGITPVQTNRLIDKQELNSDFLKRYGFSTDSLETQEIKSFIEKSGHDFPSSSEMSSEARVLCYLSGISKTLASKDPDKALLLWTDSEYRLFTEMTNYLYGSTIKNGFDNMNDFFALSKKLDNQRKSRAGKSLEHHLEAIFKSNHLKFTAQGITEGRKRPDFIFPSVDAYHDMTFDADNLITLAAKTTCKDRWRQILNEADRRKDKNKYLCTLQQGISPSQMDEMQAEQVILVVPKRYITTFPPDRQDRIWTIRKFISFVQEKEGIS